MMPAGGYGGLRQPVQARVYALTSGEVNKEVVEAQEAGVIIGTRLLHVVVKFLGRKSLLLVNSGDYHRKG